MCIRTRATVPRDPSPEVNRGVRDAYKTRVTSQVTRKGKGSSRDGTLFSLRSLTRVPRFGSHVCRRSGQRAGRPLPHGRPAGKRKSCSGLSHTHYTYQYGTTKAVKFTVQKTTAHVPRPGRSGCQRAIRMDTYVIR